MDNDSLIDEQDDAIVDDQSDLVDSSNNPAETKSIGIGWRAIIAAIALLVVAFLAYSSFQTRSATNTGKTPPPTEVQATLSAPEATAQANPDSAQAQFELGNTYVQSGQFEQALQAYQKAIELDPNYQAAYANLGVVYYQLQQLELAALQYQKALELNPNDGEVAYNLGALYLQQALSSGDQPDPDLLDRAIVQIKRAMELSPNLAEPYFTLGVAYNALNRREEAIQAFETFLARDSGHDSRANQEAQRYLENLRSQP